MADKQNYTSFTLQIPRVDLDAADAVLQDIGLSRSAAIRLFLRQVAIQKRIPFDLTSRQYAARGINGNSPDDIFP